MGLIESLTFYHPGGKPAAAIAPIEDVYFTASDGTRLHAWYVPPQGRVPGDPPAPAVIHCHGNAGNVEDHQVFSDFVSHAGLGVLLFDYRGFGNSDSCSIISRGGCMCDAEAALDYLLTRPDVDRHRIGVYGYSLGGAFAL
ncbi:MAG TPA: alpha/beta fold hydrolase, partial [Phycisphaerales bacterium]|nr:alpha/beta fold hydrolase [Phycisphaerales bacterium]